MPLVNDANQPLYNRYITGTQRGVFLSWRSFDRDQAVEVDVILTFPSRIPRAFLALAGRKNCGNGSQLSNPRVIRGS